MKKKFEYTVEVHCPMPTIIKTESLVAAIEVAKESSRSHGGWYEGYPCNVFKGSSLVGESMNGSYSDIDYDD